MRKKIISKGTDYTYMLPIFREVLLKSGMREKDNLIFAGCQGPCYSMATFLSFGIRDLNLNLYFAVDADIQQLWKLEYIKNLGVVASRKEDPVKAKGVILMSGLMRVPFKNILKFIKESLLGGGILIGETVAPGLFEEKGWDKQIPFNYLFEFSMENPTSFEVEGK